MGPVWGRYGAGMGEVGAGRGEVWGRYGAGMGRHVVLYL